MPAQGPKDLEVKNVDQKTERNKTKQKRIKSTNLNCTTTIQQEPLLGQPNF